MPGTPEKSEAPQTPPLSVMSSTSPSMDAVGVDVVERKEEKKRIGKRFEVELEEDPIMQYLMQKTVEQYDSCLWFSRGMHHVQMPGARLHTSVQKADKDEYIAVAHNGEKWKMCGHSFRQFVQRVTPGVLFGSTTDNRRNVEPNTKRPHLHLCIITRKGAKPHGCDTMNLAESLALCDRRQLPAYVECCDGHDLEFYKARGFVVVERIEDLGSECTPMFAMWREPRVRS